MPPKKDPNLSMKALTFIRNYSLNHGYPPTIREIADGVQYASTSTAEYHLSHLVEWGYIERTPNISRGIKVTPLGEQYKE